MALDHARALRRRLVAVLDAAVDAGELDGCDTDRLARPVEVTYNGALMTWAVHRTGTVADWCRDDLELLLRPHRRRA